MCSIKVSIILATYNRATFLRRMLDSVLNQKFKEYELVLINDGSVDDTASICRKYAEIDNRIRFIDLTKNKGLSNARNVGIHEARAEYIAFIDDDDFCEPNMFSHLYSMVKDYNADIAVTGCVDEYDDHIKPKFVYDEILILNKVEGLEEFLKREKFHTAPPTKIFRKALFEEISFREDAALDDIHVIYKLFAEANIIVCQGLPTYRFKKHGNNITSFIQTNKITPEILDEYLAMQRERVSYLSRRVPEITARVRYAQFSYMISMIDKITTYRCKNCERQDEFMRNVLVNNKEEFLNSSFITDREKKLFQIYI